MVKITEIPSPHVAYTQDNRFGVIDIAVTGSSVFALYSGKIYREDLGGAFGSQTLLEYDWEENLVRSCLFDESLVNISYDRNENGMCGEASSGMLTEICVEK